MGKKNSIDNLMMYTKFITSLIKYANELGIDVIKTAKLIQKGNLKKFGYYYEDVFLSIFLDSIREDNDGKDIKDNVLSYNSKNLDK